MQRALREASAASSESRDTWLPFWWWIAANSSPEKESNKNVGGFFKFFVIVMSKFWTEMMKLIYFFKKLGYQDANKYRIWQITEDPPQ
jgi:hypothetical protein